MKRRAIQQSKYIVADYLSTLLALLIFNVARFYLVPEIASTYSTLPRFISSWGVLCGMLIYPPVMMLVYYIAGCYSDVFRRSRLNELVSTALCSAVGALLYFFAALVNDLYPGRLANYELIALMAVISFVIVYIPRCLLTAAATRRIRSGKWGDATFIVGTGDAALRLAADLDNRYRSMAMTVKGYVDLSDNHPDVAPDGRPILSIDDLADDNIRHDIARVIILPHPRGNRATIDVINKLFPLDIPMLVTPDIYHLLMVRPRMDDIAALPLVNISGNVASTITLNLKRVSDVVVSAAVLLVSAPLLLAIAVAVKLDSPGPVFFRQQRVGFHKRPFNIIKFRSMRVDAEAAGPSLSSENDPRITRLGRFLRKYRLDELPNFFNVLRGEMSIVGPRPEREFYVRKIIEKAPYYTLVHSVRPGITSWGMVRYGYAKTVDAMVERLKFDIIYLDNISFIVDMKILIYTVKTVLTGRGM